MSARKLSRVAGLVFVLAAVIGGTGAAAARSEHANTTAITTIAAPELRMIEVIWD